MVSVAPVTLYNTMSRSKESFTPLHAGTVGMYSCGPTVYHYAHIGNLRTYLFSDLVKRTLRFAGYAVTQVMNITDVGHLTSDGDTGEDKMEKGAAREGKNVWQVAQFYTDAFERDIAALNIIPPDTWCKATDHIPEQIEQVNTILEKGYGYVIEDGVYFDTAKLADYGKLARLDLEQLKAGARIDVVSGKRNPTDFALWKLSPRDGAKRQMEWDSPWGRGFPGWHIECSAMAVKYLGPTFDIHTGGIDHIPVHHTNEIAQAEACGLPFARYWLHGEFLVIRDSEKMAKSGENFLTLSTLIERGYDPLVFRYLCLGTHYRKQLAFSWEAMDGAQAAFASLRNKVLAAKDAMRATDTQDPARAAQWEAAFRDALADDCNAPQALAALRDTLADSTLSPTDKYALALRFDEVLGLDLIKVGDEPVPEEIQSLVTEREAARAAKDWKHADKLRAEIGVRGFTVRDTPSGPQVRPQ